MKSRIIKNICIGIAISGILASAAGLYFKSFVDSSKDYKRVLSVQNYEDSTLHKKQYDSQSNDVKDYADNKQKEISSINEKSVDKESVLEKKADIINLLFLGIDRTDYRDKTMGVYRTDTIIIASINLDTKKTSILSIPRDTYVYIPAIDKKDKINHAYVWGGMKKEGIESSIDTIQRFIKYAEINYYFALDMEPVTEIIDDLGGVEVDVEKEMKTHGANLDKGLQVLNGEQAFHYVHWRFDGNGDIDRVKRQQKFLKALMTKFNNKSGIMDAINIVLKYGKHIQTNLSNSKIIALTELYKDINSENITYYDIPGSGEYIDNISYWIPNESETEKIFKNIFGK